MCGSYVLIAGEKFGIRFGVSGFSKIPTTFNARPSQVLPVITMQEGQKSVELMSSLMLGLRLSSRNRTSEVRLNVIGASFQLLAFMSGRLRIVAKNNLITFIQHMTSILP
jgi:hypothetical protein